MAELGLPSRTILSIVSQEHMPRDRDASNPVALDPVPPTGSVAVPGYISALGNEGGQWFLSVRHSRVSYEK